MALGYTLVGVTLSLVAMLPLTMKWNIATHPNLLRAFVIALIAAIPFCWIYPLCGHTWERAACIAIQVIFTFMISLGLVLIRFWRDPERTPAENRGVIISPADGKVIYIRQLPQNTIPLVSKDGHDFTLNELTGVDILKQNYGTVVIGIDMNIMNVHVNRCPIEGYVKTVQHIPGGYFSLRRPDALFRNTRCTTLISNDILSVATVQVSSRLVRKIDNYLRPGQSVCLGQRLGMIKFGSQVALILPDGHNLQVETSIGQNLVAGVSILARYQSA